MRVSAAGILRKLGQQTLHPPGYGRWWAPAIRYQLTRWSIRQLRRSRIRLLRKTCRQRTINAGAFADLRRLVGLSEIPSRCALLAIDAGGLCISKLVRVPPRTTAVRNECRCSSRPIASGRATRDQSKAARWSYKMAPSRSERPTNRRSGRSSSASGWPERVPQLRTRRAEPPN